MTRVWGVRQVKRNYIEIWIFLLLLFSVNFFDFLPITEAIGPNGPFTFYLLSLFLVFTFYRQAWIRDSADWLRPFWWFLFGVFLSFIPAQLYYGQSFVQSFFTNRRMFEFVAFPILIALRPSERELRTSLYAFSILYLTMTLLITLLGESWVFVGENSQFIEEGDYVHVLPGIRFIALAFIFAIQRSVKDSNRSNLFWVFFEFGILFLIQNRTSLIAAVCIILFVIYKMRMNANKLILVTAILLAVLLFGIYTSGQWGILYQTTVEQLLNPDYNRNKAFLYMFGHRTWVQYLLGSGFISANVDPIILTLQESGIFHSDVGLVGLWHMYGVIPFLTVLVMALRGFFVRKSMAVKAGAIYILVGAPTMSFFAFGETLLWLSIYLYMYYSESVPGYADNRVSQRRVGWEGRYRSIAR